MLKEFQPILKNKNFIYLWVSQILSQLSIQVMNFLLLIRLYAQTGSSIATSFLWVAYALPSVVVGPIASAIVDMASRRKILVITNLLQSLTILFFALMQRESLFSLYGAVFVYSLLNQFYVPAESATLPSVVKEKTLPHANSLFFLTQQGSIILGFGFAGFLNQIVGFETSLIICAIFLFIAFISTTLLPDMKMKNNLPKSFEKAFLGFFSKILEGYRFIKSNRNVYTPYLIILSLQIVLSVLVVNIPAIAKEILIVPLNMAGPIVVIPGGIGAGLGALLVTKLLKREWRKKKAIEVSFVLIAISVFLLAFIVPTFIGFARYIAIFVVLIMAGAGAVGLIIPAQTYMQESTPLGLRGRVFGNFWFLTTAITVLPVVFSGTLIEILGVKTLLFIIAVLAYTGFVLSKKFGQKFIINGGGENEI